MSKLLLEKIVDLNSDEDINTLNSGDVVNVGKRSITVFDRREGDVLFFYSPHIVGNGAIVEFQINRDQINVAGGWIQFTGCYYDKYLTSSDGDYYKTRRNYLEFLGQMKRI